MVAITPFGLTGPYAAYRAHHLVTFHAGGEGSILPSGAGWKRFPGAAAGPDRERHRRVRRRVERGGCRARRLLRPAADRTGSAHRRLGAGVAAHAEPHAPQPVQQRRRHAPPRRQSVRLLRDDRSVATVGSSWSGSRPTSGTRWPRRPTPATSPIRTSRPRPPAPPTWQPPRPRSSRGAGRATRRRSCAS